MDIDFNLHKVFYIEGEGNHPIERSGHRMVSHGKDIYVWGGLNTNVPFNDPVYQNDWTFARTNPCFKEMWKFSYLTKTWQLLPNTGDIPEHLVGFGMCIVGDIIYVYGGTKIPIGERNSNRLYSFDINTQEWTLLANQIVKYPIDEFAHDMPALEPDPMYGQAVVGKGLITVDDHKRFPTSCIYVFGGVDNQTPPEYSNHLYEYNSRTTQWTQLTNRAIGAEVLNEVAANFQIVPPAVYRAEMAFHDDCVYVLGGGNTISAQEFEVIKAYNVRTMKWNTFVTVADYDDSDVNNIIDNGYPEGRRAFACAQYRHHVFIIGGTDSYEVFDDIWRLDLVTLRWTFICQMPTPLKFHAASVSDEGLLSIFGGVSDHPCYYRTRDLFCMNVNVQRLDQLALNAVQQYGGQGIQPHVYQQISQTMVGVQDHYRQSLN